MIFCPLWLALGVTAGFVAALVRGRPMRLGKAIFFGLTSGCIATVVIPFIAAILFPSSRPEVIVPDDYGVRLMNYLVGSVCLCLAALRVGGLADPVPARPS